MRAAVQPVQCPADAKLLVVDADGRSTHGPRAALADHLSAGDLLVANDASTLPASLRGTHEPTGREAEVRLAGRRSLAFEDVRGFTAVVFGEGDHRIRTEDRPAPPPLSSGDRFLLGPLRATVRQLLGHPRLVRIGFEGEAERVWAGIARHGRPIQYAHMQPSLALWDVWTSIAARPVAFEPPSAGFLLDWRLLDDLRRRGVGFATLTHAAGISSTGDPALDTRLPFDEGYHLPAATVRAMRGTKARGGRVIALGTTVTRALEHAASLPGGLVPGYGLADQRLGPESEIRLVDAVVSGTHEPGESHHELLQAFAPAELLEQLGEELEA
ncbi:MAG: S-adenosylmethionine:tRNA ribosyltransferase-isomerase, partial [Holophagales bacterium]|nr:S-adenosylmethionine:tRNA ribosyltransferase-isomerase [Holophagales bacterium]